MTGKMSGVARKGPSARADLVAGVCTASVFIVNIGVEIDEPFWLTVTALICLGLAVPFAFLPFLHLARYGEPKSGDAFFKTTRVADRGVYVLVRHPQYLGYSLLVLGVGLLDPHPLALGLAGSAIAFFYVQCLVEERYCLDALGDDYKKYMNRVPRLNALVGLYRMVSRRFTKA